MKNSESIQFCQFNPFLGLIPLEISDIYPASHYVMADSNYEPETFTEFTKTWKIFFDKNNFSEVYLDKDNEFITYFSKLIPKGIRKRSLK